MRFTVAIDGPAAAGKGTVAKAVAVAFGFAHLDTGLLYRAVGAKVLDGASPLEAARGLTATDLQRDDLRSGQAGEAASQVAALPEIRIALLDFQRAFAAKGGGAVLDGRDIGTVICPDADVKLFVTASDDVRAERRWRELVGRGEAVTKHEVLDDLRARDRRDRDRATAPLAVATDATTLDTSTMTIDQAVARAIALVSENMPDRHASP